MEVDILISPISQMRKGANREGKSVSPEHTAGNGIHIHADSSTPKEGFWPETHCRKTRPAISQGKGHVRPVSLLPPGLGPGPSLLVAHPAWGLEPAPPPPARWALPPTGAYEGLMWIALLFAVSLLILFVPIMSSKPL